MYSNGIDNRVNEGDRKLPFAGLLFPLNLYCSLATHPTYPYNAERRLKDQLTQANFWRFFKTDTVSSCTFFPSKGRAVIAKYYIIFFMQQIHFFQHLYLQIIAGKVSFYCCVLISKAQSFISKNKNTYPIHLTHLK